MMEIICNGLEDRRRKTEWKKGKEKKKKLGIIANFSIWKDWRVVFRFLTQDIK